MLIIPDEAIRGLSISDQELREEIATLLYRKGLALGKAASVAEMDRENFRQLLASRRIPLNYDVEDLEHDVMLLHDVRRSGEDEP